jgi:site-specific DNA recombinase
MHRESEGDRPWDKNDILRILRNPVYAGLIRSDEGLVAGEHEALIDRETFDRVQSILDGQKPRATPAARNPEYILRGLIRCGGCRAAMTAASSKARGTAYRYYRCTTRDKRGRDACPVRQVSAPRAEAAVVTELSRLATDPRLVDAVVGRVRARLTEEIAGLEAERGPLAAQVARLAADSERTSHDHTELAAAHARLAEVDQRLALATTCHVEASWIGEVLETFDQVWQALTVENRSRLVRALVERVTIDADSQAHIDLVNLEAAAGETRAL